MKARFGETQGLRRTAKGEGGRTGSSVEIGHEGGLTSRIAEDSAADTFKEDRFVDRGVVRTSFESLRIQRGTVGPDFGGGGAGNDKPSQLFRAVD